MTFSYTVQVGQSLIETSMPYESKGFTPGDVADRSKTDFFPFYPEAIHKLFCEVDIDEVSGEKIGQRK